MDEDCAATSLGWLPRKLAPQVRVVLSLVNDCAQHKAMLERERKAQEVHLLPLEEGPRRVRVLTYLVHYKMSTLSTCINVV